MKRSSVILITALTLTGLLNLTFVSFAQQQIPKGGKWLKKAEMPTIRSDLAAVAVGGKIYAMGGRNSAEGLDRLATVEEYNPVTDTWKKVADMPTARTRFVAAAVNGKIYALGGVTTVKRRDGKLIAKSVKPVDEYDPATNTWATKGEIPAASNVAASVLDGKIYVMALGLVDNGVIIYDPATDTSAEGPKLIEGRWALMSGAANGKVYVFGGFRKENHIVETVEEYDPAQNTWVKKQDWAKPKYLCGPSVATVNGQIYVISGSTGADDGWALRKTVEAYDPAKDAWTKLKNIPTARLALATAASRGKIYAIGGVVKKAVDFRNGQAFKDLQEEKQSELVEEYTPEGWPFAVSPQGKLATTWATIKVTD